jgi:ribosomal protein S12 methylthiotransferase accessory factor
MTVTAAVWAQACERLGAAAGPGLAVRTAVLGVRDELAARTPASRPDAGAARETGADGGADAVPVWLAGRHAIVGPLGPRSCERCLARRWQRVRDAWLREALEADCPVSAAGQPPFVTPFAAQAVASLLREHLRCTSGDRPREFPAATAEGDWYPDVYQIDLETLRVTHVRLVPDPDCPACGVPVPDTPDAPDLPLAPPSSPGSLRAAVPEDYELPLDALVNPVCGVLGANAAAQLDLPGTSTVFGSFSERSGDDLYRFYWGGHANAFARSLRVGVLEGLERYAGMRPRGRRVARVAALDELRGLGLPALDPRRCGLYDAEFYGSGAAAEPFSPGRPIPWVWGHSLRDRSPVLVPEILTYYYSEPEAERFVQECSNGCASGASLTEAALHGLLELIEREAFLLAWYARVPLPEIDARTSRRPATRYLIDRLALHGYRARFFDTRLAFPLPVVTAVAQRTRPGLGALCFGAGCAPDPEDALSAALAEIASDAPPLRGRAERRETQLRKMADDFTAVESIEDHPILYGLPEMTVHAAFLLDGAPRPLLSLAELAAEGKVPPPGRAGDGGLRDELDRCVAMVAAAGFDVIAVDQTAPEQRRLGLHTASVIAPGLLPIDFGWNRQRAPRMPRLRQVTGAAEPNPAPHPFP